MIEQYAVIFVNGDLQVDETIRKLVTDASLMVSADGGYRHAKRLNVIPDALIGDLDSILPEDLHFLQQKKIRIDKFPTQKNETDLELALDWVVQQGFKKIFILGAIGDRIDQTLGNIFLLSHPDYVNLQISLRDAKQEVFLVRDHGLINGNVDDRVSLLPLSEKVTGIQTDGLLYPLKDEILNRWLTRGISNELTKNTGSIKIKSGLLLVIHEFGTNEEKEKK